MDTRYRVIGRLDGILIFPPSEVGVNCQRLFYVANATHSNEFAHMLGIVCLISLFYALVGKFLTNEACFLVSTQVDRLYVRDMEDIKSINSLADDL